MTMEAVEIERVRSALTRVPIRVMREIRGALLFSPVARCAGLAAVLTVVALLCGGCAASKKFAYEGWGRDRAQQPERVVEALRIAPGSRVADLGAGGGYFTFRFADAVGADGRVYAIDIDPDMLGYLRERVAEDGYGNVEVVEASGDDPHLPAGGVDLLFTCNTYHHLQDREAYFARLQPALRPDGRVAIVEYDGSGFFGWLFGHATSPETIRTEMEAAGYRLAEQHDFLSDQSFLIFVPGR
jgi:SAM-dependent methyltransferase